MNPAFSVIFLTTLIGCGQGLFLALYLSELLVRLDGGVLPESRYFSVGSLMAVGFMAAGLLASFFHLGHPERAWRSAAMWKTSWLSREVIALPLTMLAIFVYGVLHYPAMQEETTHTIWVGAIATVLTILLFFCTGMIYACIRFLQEWATPLTVINFLLMGCASGFLLAAAFTSVTENLYTQELAGMALVLTVLAGSGRCAALLRNRHLRPKSTLQSAIGVKHDQIVQRAQGFMGGAFNTREFFHRHTEKFVRSIKWIFLLLAFLVPVLLLIVVLANVESVLLFVCFGLQFSGLLFERWYFFADANHPQNIYYQAIG